MSMPAIRGFFRKKALRYVIIFFIVIAINFSIPRLMPGNPLVNLFGEDATNANPALLAELKSQYGLDQPIWNQYLSYLAALFRFDLGYSIDKHMAVSSLISANMANTLMLLIPALILSASLALITGSWCGLHRGKNADKFLTPLTLIVYCMPVFLLAMVALSVFAFHLGWFPLGHQATEGTEGLIAVLDTAYHLALPIMVLTLVGLVGKHLIVRNAVAQISNEDFILVARSKGYREQTIVRRHILRNVLPQFISMVALNIGFLVEGAVVIEVIFSLNGMGTLLYNAVLTRDYPVIQGCFLILTVTVLISNLIADALYGLVDPRIDDFKKGETTI
jgi:peptide/nickel transport system permease protein